MAAISKLVVHHSASPMAMTTRVKIAQWHAEKQIRPIGYHKLITSAGIVQDGRCESTMGAHAKGANLGSLGVCVFGNFEVEMPTQRQIDALIDVLAGWCREYGLKAGSIYGHCDVPGGTTRTDCPGKNLRMKMPIIRERVKRRLSNSTGWTLLRRAVFGRPIQLGARLGKSY